MQAVRINPNPPELGPDPHPLVLAQHLAAYLLGKTSGALFGKWDQAGVSGLWFYSKDTTAVFDTPAIDEVVFRETVRSRFRSVVFRLGSMASGGDGRLCGAMRLVPDDPAIEPGPGRRYVVHASFEPAAGLWFKAAILPDDTANAPAMEPGAVQERGKSVN